MYVVIDRHVLQVVPVAELLRLVLNVWLRCSAAHRIVGLAVAFFSSRGAPSRLVHDSTELWVTRDSCSRFAHSFILRSTCKRSATLEGAHSISPDPAARLPLRAISSPSLARRADSLAAADGGLRCAGSDRALSHSSVRLCHPMPWVHLIKEDARGRKSQAPGPSAIERMIGLARQRIGI